MNEEPIDHDQLFKNLFHHCFELFIQLFFPQQAAQLSFSTAKFLQQEQFTEFPSGERRFMDTVVEVNTLSDESNWILIHAEFQAKRSSAFPLRMFRYFCQLRLRHDCLIWPIVVYLPSGSGGIVLELYSEELFSQEYEHFYYHAVGLPELDVKRYLATGNPVAYALAPLMNRGNLSKAQLKAICLSGIAQSNVIELQRALLAYFVDVYLPLSQEEEQEFRQLVTEQEVVAMEFITSWERKGRVEGRVEGHIEGALEALRGALLMQLREKFGQIPQTIETNVQSIESTEKLSRLLAQVIHANSLVEIEV